MTTLKNKVGRPKTYLTPEARHEADKKQKRDCYHKNKAKYLETKKKNYHFNQEFKRLRLINI